MLIKIEEGLYFGNAQSLKDRLRRAETYGDLNVHPGENPNTFNSATRSTPFDAFSSAYDILTAVEIEERTELKFVIFEVESMTSIDAR